MVIGHLWSSSGCEKCERKHMTHTQAAMTTNSKPLGGALLMKIINKPFIKKCFLHYFFVRKQQINHCFLPPDREGKVSDWKGFPVSWCCVSDLSVRLETLMDCRALIVAHTHAKSLQGRPKCFPFSFTKAGQDSGFIIGIINAYRNALRGEYSWSSSASPHN